MNAGDVRPAPAAEAVEDRWILSRLERTVELVGERIDAYDFSHAALELYRFIFSELCDWYLEIVKPRLYDGDEPAAANLLHVLERTLALTHPVMPFVTEAVWDYLPDRAAELIASPFPVAERERFDEAAEAEVGEAIELTRALRRWRELAGVSPGAVLSARPAAGAREPHPLVARLARLEVDGAGAADAIASVASLEILPSEGLEAAAVEERMAERRRKLESEVARAEGKLSNRGFVDNAPPEVVESEREKLERYRSELAELGG
jgi:valyl-tRNA synthetase